MLRKHGQSGIAFLQPLSAKRQKSNRPFKTKINKIRLADDSG